MNYNIIEAHRSPTNPIAWIKSLEDQLLSSTNGDLYFSAFKQYTSERVNIPYIVNKITNEELTYIAEQTWT